MDMLYDFINWYWDQRVKALVHNGQKIACRLVIKDV